MNPYSSFDDAAPPRLTGRMLEARLARRDRRILAALLSVAMLLWWTAEGLGLAVLFRSSPKIALPLGAGLVLVTFASMLIPFTYFYNEKEVVFK